MDPVRAGFAWIAILVLASVNGGFRQVVLTPRWGDRAAHIASTLMLSGIILVMSWFVVPWIRPASTRDAWLVGFLWVLLTLAFEFLAGHYLFGSPWEKLLQDYHVERRRIWILALTTTLLAPVLVQRFRGL